MQNPVLSIEEEKCKYLTCFHTVARGEVFHAHQVVQSYFQYTLYSSDCLLWEPSNFGF